MRKELLNKANFAWLLLSVVSFVVLTILMKVGIIGSYYSITLYNIFINIILAVFVKFSYWCMWPILFGACWIYVYWCVLCWYYG